MALANAFDKHILSVKPIVARLRPVATGTARTVSPHSLPEEPSPASPPTPGAADLDELLDEFTAISAEIMHLLATFNGLMSIVEDAVCQVQTVGSGRRNPGDLVRY